MNNRQKLWSLAKDAFTRAYAPYSRFAVGAAVLTAEGRMYAAATLRMSLTPTEPVPKPEPLRQWLPEETAKSLKSSSLPTDKISLPLAAPAGSG